MNPKNKSENPKEGSENVQDPVPESPGNKLISEMSPEDLEVNRKRFLFRQGFIDEDPDGKSEPEPKEAPKDTTPPKDTKKDSSTEPGKEKKAATNKPKSVAPVVAPGLTREDVSAAVEAGARAAIESTRPSKPEKTVEKEPEIELSEEDKRTLEALKLIESDNPGSKGLVQRTIEFWKKEPDYIREWERKHPGEEFDKDDPQHSDFYDTNEPVVNEEEFAAAKIRLVVEPVERKAKEAVKAAEEVRKKSDQIELDRKIEKTLPDIANRVDKSLIAVIDESAPELAKLLGEGDNKTADESGLKKIEEEDPVAFDIIQSEAERVRILCSEFELLTSFPGAYQFNPSAHVALSDDSTMSPHSELVKLINDTEQDIKAMPRAETDREHNGKVMRFMPQKEMRDQESEIAADQRLTEAQKQAKIRDLRQSTWTLSVDDIRKAIISESAWKIKSRIEKAQKLFDLRASKKGQSAGKSTPDAKPKKEQSASGSQRHTSAPAIAASSDKLNNASGSTMSAASIGDMALSKTFGA